ncbi:MAG: signal peptidase I [Actinobacteria bacterium]|nr:signal peptidase I [Actinomycetota bacterium]
MRRALEYALVVVVAVVTALAVQAWLVKPYRIPSASMLDTLRPGDRVLVNHAVYRLQDPERGDIVVFRYPEDPDMVFIKRIVGVPGDVLELRDGRLYVNGRELEEPYVHRTGGHPDPTVAEAAVDGSTLHDPWSLAEPYRVPGGTYFVMGDNRTDSDDSREWGTVPREAIVGEGFATYWPLSRLRAL